MKRIGSIVVAVVGGLLLWGGMIDSVGAVQRDADSAKQLNATPIDPTQGPPRRLPGEAAREETQKPRFVKGQLIVKYKDSVTECVHCLLRARKRFKDATTDQSDSLDRLHAEYQVRAARAVFRTDTEEAHLPGTQVRTLKQHHQDRFAAVKRRFAQRAQRAPKGAILPDLSHVYVLDVPAETDVEAAAAEFARDPHVAYAQPNYLAEAYLIPNDPYYASSGSWGQPYDDLWGLKKMDMAAAWGRTQGQGVVVAVVDTGVDYTHPDLAANIWTNSKEIPSNGLDDDGNGYVDDVKGWDFVGASASSPAPDNDPMDGFGHGTHVAGTIAAVGNNSLGIVGVAYKAKVMAVKGLDNAGSGTFDELAQGLVYAAANGADVINNSWGCSYCPSNPVVEEAVRTATGLGAIVVFAAGNSSDDVARRSPQNMTNPKPVVVAASTQTDTPTFFTSFGALVDVAAPGGGTKDPPPSVAPYRNILSLKAGICDAGMCNPDLVVGTNYVRQAGTSMAAPHAAGVAALILSYHPDFTIDEVRTVLRTRTDDINTPGFDPYTGYGRVNADKATLINSPCVAAITVPAPGAYLAKPTSVLVQGTAQCRAFKNYTLEVGEGASPTSWVTIQSGTSQVTNGLLGTWDASGAQDGTFTLRLTVKNTSLQIFRAYSQPLVFRNLHEGWPKDFGVFEFPAALSDLDGDGLKDVVFNILDSPGFGSGITMALRHDGTMLPGWPIDWKALTNQTSVSSNLAIGDIDGDRRSDVVVSAPLGPFYAFHGNGTILAGWPQGPAPTRDGVGFFGDPMLVDLDGDGVDEVVVPMTFRERINGVYQYRAEVDVWRGNGTTVSGWPQRLPLNRGSGLVVSGDVDGDGQPEIGVVEVGAVQSTGQTATVCAIFNRFGQMLSGWPVQVPGESLGSGFLTYPTFGDLTGDGLPELIFMTSRVEGNSYHTTIRALQADGTSPPNWPVDANLLLPDGYSNLLLQTLGDLNGDGLPEVLFIANGYSGSFSKVVILQADGALLPGWPVQLPIWAVSPLIADVNGDGQSDLIVAGEGAVYALDRSGVILPGWPKPLPGHSIFAPAIGDVDGDSKLELLVGGGTDTPLFLYDLDQSVTSAQTLQWPMFQHDPQRTGLFPIPLRVLSLTDSPDPFSPNSDKQKDTTTISGTFNRTLTSGKLHIFNSANTLVRSFGWGGSTTHLTQSWDGTYDGGGRVPDGTYSYTLIGFDAQGNQAQRSGTVTVDTTAPTFNSVTISPNPFKPSAGQPTTIAFSLSEAATVTVQIYNSAGTLVRTLLSNSLVNANVTQNLVWDGKTPSGSLVAPGTYTALLWVVDLASNKAGGYPIYRPITVQ